MNNDRRRRTRDVGVVIASNQKNVFGRRCETRFAECAANTCNFHLDRIAVDEFSACRRIRDGEYVNMTFQIRSSKLPIDARTFDNTIQVWRHYRSVYVCVSILALDLIGMLSKDGILSKTKKNSEKNKMKWYQSERTYSPAGLRQLMPKINIFVHNWNNESRDFKKGWARTVGIFPTCKKKKWELTISRQDFENWSQLNLHFLISLFLVSLFAFCRSQVRIKTWSGKKGGGRWDKHERFERQTKAKPRTKKRFCFRSWRKMNSIRDEPNRRLRRKMMRNGKRNTRSTMTIVMDQGGKLFKASTQSDRTDSLKSKNDLTFCLKGGQMEAESN